MNEPWVNELRAQFPVAQKLAFFDIAYENCGASFVRESMEQYLDQKADIRPGIVKAGGKGKGETIGIIADAREKLAKFLGAPSIQSVAFTENTCQAVNLLLQGFPFAPGDNVVVGDLEHVSVLMPCLYLKEKGVDCKVVPSKDGMTLSAEELLAAVDDHTRVVVVSYVQSRSGYKIDLPKLARECHKRGIWVITDAIQALGFQPVDVNELGCDALVSSCYKGILGVEGVGFLYCSDPLLELVKPTFAGDSPALTIDKEKWEIVCPEVRDARKFESGTIPFQAIYGLRAGISRLLEIGTDNIGRHVDACFRKVYEGMTALGYDIVTPFEPEHRCHSMAIRVDHNAEMVDYCLEHGVFFSKGVDSYIRIAVAPFTTQEDIDTLLKVAGDWKNR